MKAISFGIDNQSVRSKMEKEFDQRNLGLPGAPEPGLINGHGYVDLGLGVLWATCNIGASSQDDPGHYFAWGETDPKDTFTQENYQGKDKTCLEPGDDPAHVHWGGSWRMPTRAELYDLIHACEWDVYWRSGERPYCRVTSKTNGNSIILPRGGYRDENGPHEGDEKGHLRLDSVLDKGSGGAPCLSIGYCHMWECDMIEYGSLPRYFGVPVRPVAKKEDLHRNLDLHRDLDEIIQLHYMPKFIHLALDNWGKKPGDLLGYRMVFQRKTRHETTLEEEIRLVDGSEFTQPAKGKFEHAFLQLCLPLVRYNYRTVELPSRETKVYVDGVNRTRYWMDTLVDVPGGEKEARRCLEWLREWVDSHRRPSRILDAETVAQDLRKEGKRVPIRMHICYQDVPDPENHGRCTRELARGHQDMVAWKSEEVLERAKPDYLLDGEISSYAAEIRILAKIQLDKTLGIDCESQKIDVSCVESEYARLMEGMRFLTEEDVRLLRRRLASRGKEIEPEALYEGLDQVYVRRISWKRSEPFPYKQFFEYRLLSDPVSGMDDTWDASTKAIPLSDFSVEEIAGLLKM